MYCTIYARNVFKNESYNYSDDPDTLLYTWHLIMKSLYIGKDVRDMHQEENLIQLDSESDDGDAICTAGTYTMLQLLPHQIHI